MGDREKASLRLQFNPQIRLELHGATITSDAGLLAFRELDDALDLTPIASDYLQESRTGRNIRHHLVPLLRQSIYSRLAGYDDTNDADYYDWPDEENHHKLLRKVREYCRELHHLVTAAYFDYPIEDFPGR